MDTQQMIQLIAEYFKTQPVLKAWLFGSRKEDIMKIPQRKNRTLYGYAEMNVGDIRNIKIDNVIYDVRSCDNDTVKSHAGIYIMVNNEKLVGGKPFPDITDNNAQDFMLLSIREELVKIAQRGLTIIPSIVNEQRQKQ